MLHSVDVTLRIQSAKLKQQLNKLLEQNMQILELTAERDAALAQVEQLKGIKPEMPPRPPHGDGLPRFGIKWNGEYEPISTPMNDGYWTPYHLAQKHLREIQAEAGRAGFVAGSNRIYMTVEDKYRAADQYAERVKAGEV